MRSAGHTQSDDRCDNTSNYNFGSKHVPLTPSIKNMCPDYGGILPNNRERAVFGSSWLIRISMSTLPES